MAKRRKNRTIEKIEPAPLSSTEESTIEGVPVSNVDTKDMRQIDIEELIASIPEVIIPEGEEMSEILVRLEPTQEELLEIMARSLAKQAGHNPDEDVPSNITNEVGELVSVVRKRWVKFLGPAQRVMSANTHV